MTISLDSIEFQTELPDMPRSMIVAETKAPCLEDRKPAMDLLVERLDLGKCQVVDLPHGMAYASSRGEVEFFQASGGIWSRDARAEQGHDNELRDWPKLVEQRDDRDEGFALPEDLSVRLLERARELVEAMGLVDKSMDSGRVVLDQVVELSEKGEILRSGAGTATAVFGFSLEGRSVLGAGAKSTLAFEPLDGEPRMSGGLHVWRSLHEKRDLQMPDLEEALSIGLLEDPELTRAVKHGGQIVVTRLNLGYMALPAMMQQRYLYPVFDVQGRVSMPDDKLGYFQFARYHHAAAEASYKKAGLFAPYLATMN